MPTRTENIENEVPHTLGSVIGTSAEESSLLAGKEVLIVEDDPIFRRMVRGFLEKQACIVHEAENGLEGLVALRQSIPDILLCDLSMPVMTGMEFVEEVSMEYPMLPMIVVSGTGEMKDVAKVLRHGVKDFLVKPLDDISILESALLSVLKDTNSEDMMGRDFSSQWFGTSEDDGEAPIEKELHWHLEQLKDNPNAARELLIGLLPDQDSQLGSWKFTYRALQAMDSMPIVLDYSWLMDGRLIFYFVDSGSGGENGVGTALLVRAFFNDYIRTRIAQENDLTHLASLIEKGITHSGYAEPINALFGIFNVCNGELEILPAGLGGCWNVNSVATRIQPSQNLGNNSHENKVVELQVGALGGDLTLSEAGASSLSLTLKNLDAL